RVARVQNLLTAIKVLVLIAFVVLALTIGDGSFSHFSQHAERTSPATPISAQFPVSLFFLFLAYSGWNAATYVAEELRRPAHTLPLALGLGTALVTALYLALNIVFIYASPLSDLKGQPFVGDFAADRLFSDDVASIFTALMALSLLATVNAM